MTRSISNRTYSRTRGLALAATFAALISVVAPVSIPITPAVPFTLQVFVVYLAAMIIGPFYGALALLIYLLLGAIGLPVYAQLSAGLPILLGPTGGYLFAFPVAVFLGGLVSAKRASTRKGDARRLTASAAIVIGVIYTMGVAGLMLSGLGLWTAIYFGALLFIPLDIAKAVVAIAIALRLRWSSLQLPISLSFPSSATPKALSLVPLLLRHEEFCDRYVVVFIVQGSPVSGRAGSNYLPDEFPLRHDTDKTPRIIRVWTRG